MLSVVMINYIPEAEKAVKYDLTKQYCLMQYPHSTQREPYIHYRYCGEKIFGKVHWLMQQNTSDLLMIEPVNFGFNEETAVNNVFQEKSAIKILKESKFAVIRLPSTSLAISELSITSILFVAGHLKTLKLRNLQ